MFANLTALMTSTPWFILPEAYDGLATLYGRLIDRTEETFVRLTSDDFATPPLHAEGIDGNGIGHFVADGTLAPRLSGIARKCGGVDTAASVGHIQKMLDKGAKGVMFHVNSPGGNGGMLPELASFISNIRVPTASYTYGVEASAATWAFAGVGLKGATPSAVLGSVGGFIPWIDKSQLLERAGLMWAPIVSQGADLKMTGHGPSLSVQQREYLQQSLDQSVANFRRHLIDSRTRVGAKLDMNTISRGGSYRAPIAKELGLVDFVGDYSHVYDTLVGRARKK